MKIRFTLNDETTEAEITPADPLADLLRERLSLMGTKRGCDMGGCGMCTVLLDGKSVFSCMTPAWKVDGRQVVTVEGLARKDGKLDSLQQAFIEESAPQCGYCTSAMLIVSKELLDNNPQPSEEQVREALSAVLCRCTGYQPYIQAVIRAAKMR